MAGFAEGFNAGASGLRGAMQMAYENDRYEREFGLRQAAADREARRFQQEQEDRARTLSALRDLETLQNTGVVDPGASGMRAPSAQMLAADGYGDATGTQAVQDAAGDFSREQARMGLQRTYDQTAPVTARKASDVELTAGAQRVALARGDLGAWRAMEQDRRAQVTTEARRAEFKRVSKMADQELADLFQGSVNANPDVPAMVDFDPKARKYIIVSKIPGIPTQQLSRAEMVQAVMGAWDAGNGDYAQGVQNMIQAAQAQRAMENQNFERSRGLAKDSADAYFKGQTADAQMMTARAHQATASATQERYRQAAEAEKMGLVRQYQDPKTGEIREFYPVTKKGGGIEWQEFERPAGLRPYNPKGDSGPAKEVPAAGTIMQNGNGQAWQADGRGGKLALGAPMPDKRGKVLADAGIDKVTAETLQWTPDGRYVAHSGLAYDSTDPRDMAALRAALEQEGRDELMAAEVRARGFAPRYPTDKTEQMRRDGLARSHAMNGSAFTRSGYGGR